MAVGRCARAARFCLLPGSPRLRSLIHLLGDGSSQLEQKPETAFEEITMPPASPGCDASPDGDFTGVGHAAHGKFVSGLSVQYHGCDYVRTGGRQHVTYGRT